MLNKKPNNTFAICESPLHQVVLQTHNIISIEFAEIRCSLNIKWAFENKLFDDTAFIIHRFSNFRSFVNIKLLTIIENSKANDMQLIFFVILYIKE